MPNDLKYRCYHFSVNTVKFLKGRGWDAFCMIVAKQVMRSAMSVGANVVEAQNSSTRTEFKRFYEIALKSCTETSYWLCLLRDGFEVKDEQFEKILKESTELTKILGTSVISLKKGIKNVKTDNKYDADINKNKQIQSLDTDKSFNSFGSIKIDITNFTFDREAANER